MLNYSPINGDPSTSLVAYRPRTCFLMTQLGGKISEDISKMCGEVKEVLSNNKYSVIDANSLITGKDFLLKIWEMIVAVPLCVAILHRDMPMRTLCNIFYELGMAQSLGKETLIIKEQDTEIPSDFVRTEYVAYDEKFADSLSKYLQGLDTDRLNYYEIMADSLEKNPLLAIDYLRRAFLLSGDEQYQDQADAIFQESKIEERAKNSVEMLLMRFMKAKDY